MTTEPTETANELLKDILLDLENGKERSVSPMTLLAHIAHLENQVIGHRKYQDATARDVATAYLQIKQLRIDLFGDLETKTKYETAVRTGTWPNMPGPKLKDPPPGILDEIRASIRHVQQDLENRTMPSGALDRIEAMLDQVTKRISFTNRLEAFFGPLIDGKNPPLDGAQVASKEYVDNAVATFAAAINRKVSDVVKFYWELLQHGGEVVRATSDLDVPTSIALRIGRMWKHISAAIAEEAAAASRPSRLEALFYALRGKKS